MCVYVCVCVCVCVCVYERERESCFKELLACIFREAGKSKIW